MFEELKKKIKDIETQSLAMDGCSPSFSVSDIMSIIDSVGKDIDVTTTDTISRQAAMDLVKDVCEAILSMCGSHYDGEAEVYDDVREVDAILKCNKEIMATLKHMPSAQPEPQWIPFKTRPLTEEEKEEYPEWNCILDCKLPDDGQAILVSINLRGHERVQYDEFYSDDGSYLDSGYAIGEEATAWMPLPEPYKEKDNERA